MFQAHEDFVPDFSAHSSILVCHTVFDRAVQGAVARKIVQREALKNEKDDGQDPVDLRSALGDLLQWHLSNGCAAHDAQNGFKRGLMPFTVDAKTTSKNLFLAVHACKRGFDLLQEGLRPFIVRFLRFLPDAEAASQEDAYRYWTDLGVEPDIAQDMADMDLHFAGGFVNVRSSWRYQENLIDRICDVYIALCQFRSAADSRWITLGHSCRSLFMFVGFGPEKLAR